MESTMYPAEVLKCIGFPCQDINCKRYTVPTLEIEPSKIKTLMISEAPPMNQEHYFYAAGNPFYLQTTVQALDDAGFKVSSMKDIVNIGIYVTTAIKCAKTAYAISPRTIDNCSIQILEKEINLFPRIKAILLMGDTAIRAMNIIARRSTGKAIIPSRSTWKIREGEYFYRQMRVFPSYLQTGKSYLIEKSKRKMIAEDIKAALTLP